MQEASESPKKPTSKLRQAREQRGWTQQDVASQIDLPDTRSLRRWETGGTAPSLHYRAKLCELFESNVDELGLVPQTRPSLETNDYLRGNSTSVQEIPKDDQISIPSSASTFSSSSHTTHGDRYRQRMLKRVHTIWIKGVLEQSLQGATLLNLNLCLQPNAIASPWIPIMPQLKPTFYPSNICTHIIQVYNQACGELLILGEPGAGKTTLLLELAQHLLKHAMNDESHPIPVVLNLSSWSTKQSSLETWISDELSNKYYVPHTVSRSWIQNEYILPLLDGLDEMSPAFRQLCIEAINTFHKKHGLVSLVVCCRSDEYFNQPARLAFQQAVSIQPLTQEQIDDYLISKGDSLETVRIALREDRQLHDLVQTPLMLNILALTYQDYSMERVQEIGTLDTRRKHIIAIYVEHMLKSRKQHQFYTYQQSLHWLSWLAKQMQQRYQTHFYLERMQLNWLPTSRAQVCYGLFIGLWAAILSSTLIGPVAAPLDNVTTSFLTVPCLSTLLGIVAGIAGAKIEHLLHTPFRKVIVGSISVVFLISTGLFTDAHWSSDGTALGTAAGLTTVIVFLLLCLINKEIKPIETVNWSWTRMKQTSSLLISGTIGIGIVGGLFGWSMSRIGVGIIVILLFAVFSFLLSSFLAGLSGETVDERHFERPNEGIRRSIYYAIRTGLLAAGLNWCILTLVSIFVLKFFPALNIIPGFLFWGRLAFSAIAGIIFGLRRGGEAYIKHLLLRLMLCLEGSTPLNYVRFLDDVADHSLLRKVGGGYIFAHRMVLEYFASLDQPCESCDCLTIAEPVSTNRDSLHTISQR